MPVDVATGESYANEVYYNFDNDILKTAPRSSWDIAFKTNQMTTNDYISKVNQELGENNFPIYRLVNQKDKGFGGLYKRLFSILEKDSIFVECAEELSWFEGNDMIIVTTWADYENNLPKGIIRIK